MARQRLLSRSLLASISLRAGDVACFGHLPLRTGSVSSATQPALPSRCKPRNRLSGVLRDARRQYPNAQPSLRGSEPAVSVPLSQSIQIAWAPPSGGTVLVVLSPIFCRPAPISFGTPPSS